MKPILRGLLYIILILASAFVAVLFWFSAILLFKLGFFLYGTLTFLGIIILVIALGLFMYLEES